MDLKGGIVPKFTQADIKKFMLEKEKTLEKLILNWLTRVGLQFVTNARNVRTYQDRTGNLRSSIGFIVLKNGVTVDQNFEAAGTGPDRVTGVAKAKSFAASLTPGFTNGYTLIVVAGMHYAAYVEATKHDVITGSSLEAKKQLRQAVAGIKAQFKTTR